MDNSPVRPLLVGVIAGFIIGLLIGLFYAWQISPAVYGDGARFSNLNQLYLQNLTETVVEAYSATRNTEAAQTRLADLSAAQKVDLLARAEKNFSQSDANMANAASQLAQDLKARENWSQESVSQGLTSANASLTFAGALGQQPTGDTADDSSDGADPAAPQSDEGAAEEPPARSALANLIRIIGILFFLLVALLLVLFLLTRIKPKRRSSAPPPPPVPEIVTAEGDTLQPLRQWVGTYALGQDNYDESFTVETAESDFLGECGMGILDGFASGTPKKVAAFDVWLFDKTDIRTVSMPIMSQFAYEDDILRGKLNPDAEPILADAGASFDIETTALLVKAKIEEVEYGDEAPANSYFTQLKVSLTAYLKPGADVKGDMPYQKVMKTSLKISFWCCS